MDYGRLSGLILRTMKSFLPTRATPCSFLALVAATALLPVAAMGEALTRPINLAFLARRAEIIVQGRVLETRHEGLPNYPNIRTVVVTLEVERMWRGPEGKRYTFRQYVGPHGWRQAKAGYAAGERLLLFLPRPSSYGLSSPLGLEQGHFRIVRNRLGEDLIANQFGNLGLFKNVPETAERAGLRLDEAQLRVASTPRGAVPLRDFTSLVVRLMSLPRNE